MQILVAGGAGFIGSAFARLLRRERPSWPLVVFDKLTYAGNLRNLEEIEGGYHFVQGDIADAAAVQETLAAHGIRAVVNFAAETHVDRSIMSGLEFVETDCVGTQVLLAAARAAGVTRYVQVSTDEVYGSIPAGAAPAGAPLDPTNPYSASKAGGDHLVRAAFRTYGFPALITRGSNTYGPYQYPEKVLPLFITNLIEGRKVPLYGDGRQRREWLYVDDHARGILAVLERGVPGDVYHLGGKEELENLELTRHLLALFGRGEEWIEYVSDRPGHDRRYALDSRKAHDLGWQPRVLVGDGLPQTVAWYREREDWWKPLKSGAYLEYYRKQYGERSQESGVVSREPVAPGQLKTPDS